MALKGQFDPWAIPDNFTVYKGTPEWLQLHPHWQTQKAVRLFSGNVMVLKIFSLYKAVRTPANMLVINLAVSDLGIVIGLFPECSCNFFLGGPWRFGYIGCQIHAFNGAIWEHFRSAATFFRNARCQSGLQPPASTSWDGLRPGLRLYPRIHV